LRLEKVKGNSAWLKIRPLAFFGTGPGEIRNPGGFNKRDIWGDILLGLGFNPIKNPRRVAP